MSTQADKPRISYTPCGGAFDMWRAKELMVLFDGPAGTGKSRGGLEKCLATAMKYDRCRQLLIRATRTSMTQSVLVTFETHVAVGKDGKPLPWVSGPSRATRTSYVLPNGSEIVLGGMDNPDRIMSTEYDRIYVFEATELAENAIEQLITRLRNGMTDYHQMVLDCNPSAPSHWLKRRADGGKMRRIPSRHTDNPMLWDAKAGEWTKRGREYLETLNQLTGHRRARLLEGHWAAAEGLVYSAFDNAFHVVDAMPVGWEKWDKLRTIDFGFTNPFVCQWWAVDPDGRMYLYREYVKSKRTVSDHAPEINRLSAGENYIATIADHDAEDRAELMKANIQTIAAKKAVSVGIQAVNDRLVKQGDGKARLYVLRSALVETCEVLESAKKPCGFLAEIDSYVYPKVKEGRGEKEEPVKEHDHSMDAARYAVAYFDVGGANGAKALPMALGKDEKEEPCGWLDLDEAADMWSTV